MIELVYVQTCATGVYLLDYSSVCKPFSVHHLLPFLISRHGENKMHSRVRFKTQWSIRNFTNPNTTCTLPLGLYRWAELGVLCKKVNRSRGKWELRLPETEDLLFETVTRPISRHCSHHGMWTDDTAAFWMVFSGYSLLYLKGCAPSELTYTLRATFSHKQSLF